MNIKIAGALVALSTSALVPLALTIGAIDVLIVGGASTIQEAPHGHH